MADWYGQVLGSLFTDSPKPYEVEIVVAQVGKTTADDEIYRITFDGAVADEHDFVVVGGQAERVAEMIKEQYSASMALTAAMKVAVDSLAGQGDASAEPLTSSGLEVALLERERAHRAFRRITGARLAALLTEARAGGGEPPAGGDGAEGAPEPSGAGTEPPGDDAAGPADAG